MISGCWAELGSPDVVEEDEEYPVYWSRFFVSVPTGTFQSLRQRSVCSALKQHSYGGVKISDSITKAGIQHYAFLINSTPKKDKQNNHQQILHFF